MTTHTSIAISAQPYNDGQHGSLVPMASRYQILPARTNAQELSDFTAQLEEALRDLETACRKKGRIDVKLGELQKELENRSWWGAATAGLTGKTDKEIAKMVEGLGESLGLTQNVVRVMLKIQTKKNQLLHAFNEVLVNKITRIQSDTHVLDSNQKQAALFFLGELQQQIDEQISQQELVESHEQRLNDHQHWLLEKEKNDAALAHQVAQTDIETAALKNNIEAHDIKLSKQEQWQLKKDDGDTALNQQVSQMAKETAALKQNIEVHSFMLSSQEQRLDNHERWRLKKEDSDAALIQQISQMTTEAAALKKNIEELERRVAMFEEGNRQTRLTRTIFNSLTIMALISALAALSFMWMK